MIRVAFILFFVCVAAVIGLSVTGAPGQATVEWLGWRLDMTAAAALLAWRLLLGRRRRVGCATAVGGACVATATRAASCRSLAKSAA
jgi:hypothetical protein